MKPLTDERNVAVIFDLDGVLTDTAELHFQSWRQIAAELGVPFDRRANDALRGLGRLESLNMLLGSRAAEFDADAKARLTAEKNAVYLRLVERMTPADLLPGVAGLLDELRDSGVPCAVASSSRNAFAVLDRLEIAARFRVIIDGHRAPRSKPDPQAFLLAAADLNVAASGCVVVEDAASGIVAAQAARMRVVGIGPAERVGGADLVVAGPHELSAARLLALLA